MTLTSENFRSEVLDSDLPVLVDFWAEWCAPCHMVAPEVEALGSELDGRLKVAKLDIDENPGLAMEYGVMSIPTLLLFVDGSERARLIGAKPRQRIRAEIEPHLATAGA